LELVWIGGLPVMSPYLAIGLYYALFYFLILLFFFPLSGPIEHLVYDAYLLMARLSGNLICFFHSVVYEIGLFKIFDLIAWILSFHILKQYCLDVCLSI
jgi:uncharacterized membrane protein